ncbi:MAG: DUF192 domain-containing protein [Gammaproteobacteria bacterium]|jgi:uncharacterized membrane protein (UPF0127 family)|nr:DUF192 domain-containing protein [Gammaproteobacteria bacterium]
MPDHRFHLPLAALALAAVALPCLPAAATGLQPWQAPAPEAVQASGNVAGRGQARLPTVALRVREASLTAEVACDQNAQARGLMHRASLGDGEGMLFVFERPSWLSFWMKDTGIPLTVAYLDARGVIRELHDLEPFDSRRVDSRDGELQFALEVPRGWFARHGVGVGSVVATAAGPLDGFRCRPGGAATLP